MHINIRNNFEDITLEVGRILIRALRFMLCQSMTEGMLAPYESVVSHL